MIQRNSAIGKAYLDATKQLKTDGLFTMFAVVEKVTQYRLSLALPSPAATLSAGDTFPAEDPAASCRVALGARPSLFTNTAITLIFHGEAQDGTQQSTYAARVRSSHGSR